MRDLIKKALTRTLTVKGSRGKTQQVEIPPSQKLIYGIYFAMTALLCLTALEAAYILILHSFSSEIFAAITGLIGTITGIFISQKA